MTVPYSTWAAQRILRKSPSKSLLAADLLTPNKAIHRDSDGAVDIGAVAILAQPHLGERLADAENGFEMTDL